MHDRLIKFAHAALLAAGLAVGAPSQAATVAVDAGAACTAFSFDPQTQTLMCQVSTACVISGATSAIVNSSVTLTASCPTSAVSSYNWNYPGCDGASTCVVTNSSTGSVAYTVTGASSAQDSHSINWTNVAPVNPSGCSITATPSSLPTGGGAVALSVNCTSTGNGLATGWAWSGTGLSGATNLATANANITATQTFQVVVTSATNGTTTVSKTVTVGSGGGGFASCPGGSLTQNNIWGANPSYTSSIGAFGGNILAVQLTVPSTYPTSSTKRGAFQLAEYQSGPENRFAMLSNKACSFDTADAVKKSNGSAYTSAGNTLSMQFYVGYFGSSSYPGLVPGQTYYINVYNTFGCTSGDCSAVFSLSPP